MVMACWCTRSPHRASPLDGPECALGIRAHSGPSKGEALWGDLVHQQAITILHNPRYAGAFFFGRRRSRRKKLHVMPMDQWYVLINYAHSGYLSWDQYQANQ